MYGLVIILLMAWFALRLARPGKSKVKPAFYYTFVAGTRYRLLKPLAHTSIAQGAYFGNV